MMASGAECLRKEALMPSSSPSLAKARSAAITTSGEADAAWAAAAPAKAAVRAKAVTERVGMAGSPAARKLDLSLAMAETQAESNAYYAAARVRCAPG